MQDDRVREPWNIGKPMWMNSQLFSDLCLRWQNEIGVLSCEHPGCNAVRDLSWDHIIPQSRGGDNSFENLQPMCIHHNSSKGARPDDFWTKTLYFDRPLDLSKLRVAQSDFAYYKIYKEYADYFKRPRSDIAGYIYLWSWIVGAGKTLAIPAIAFAYNHLIRAEIGFAPRIDRILVVCKEQGLRDQIAFELGGDAHNPGELVKYGVIGQSPRVFVIRKGEQWDNDEYLQGYDIIVTCAQQLWDSNRSDEKVSSILARFPLIVFDENHTAVEQLLRMVDRAPHSICVGLTNTPIDGNADLLKRCILVSTYGYDNANQYDQSMKYLTANENEIGEHIHELTIDGDGGNALIARLGNSHTIKKEGESQDYSSQLWPILNVAREVVDYMKSCDAPYTGVGRWALHRQYEDLTVVPDLNYAMHGMIKVDNIATAQILCGLLNDGLFSADRKAYPLAEGWTCSTVNVEDGGLTLDHAWTRYKREGKLDAQCARLLIAVDMGREGMNNAYCGIFGLACHVESYIELIQRGIGRQLRAVTKREGDILHVPEQRMDSVRMVTHKAFLNRDALLSAIRWVMNMEEYLRGLPTIEDLLAGNEIEKHYKVDVNSSLKDDERISLLRGIGFHWMNRIEFEPEELAIKTLGVITRSKLEQSVDWIEKVINTPDEVRKNLRLFQELRTRDIVIRERLSADQVSDESLREYVRVYDPSHYISFSAHMENEHLRDAIRAWVASSYSDHMNRLYDRDLGYGSGRSVSKIVRSHVIKLADKNEYKSDPEYQGLVYRTAFFAAKTILGLPEGETLSEGSDYDIPQYRQVLGSEDVRRDIVGFVWRKLIDKGYFDDMGVALRIYPEKKRGGYERTTAITWR